MSKRTSDEAKNVAQETGLPLLTASFLQSGLYSDMTITCKGKVFKVHRVVVCLQSKPLAAAINGNFVESTSRNLDLNDDDPEAVTNLVNFLYTGDYGIERALNEESVTLPSVVENRKNEELDRTTGLESEDEELSKASIICRKLEEMTAKWIRDSSKPLIPHVKTYLVADQWDVKPLKVLAAAKFEMCLEYGWNSSEFYDSLRLMFDETMESDRFLKDIAIKFAGHKAKELMDRGEFVTLLKDRGVIAYELFNAHLSLCAKLPAPGSGKCPKFGLEHAKFVIRGTKGDAWFCHKCRNGFE